MNNTRTVQSILVFRSNCVVNTDYDKVEVVLHLDRKKHRKLIEEYINLMGEEMGGTKTND